MLKIYSLIAVVFSSLLLTSTVSAETINVDAATNYVNVMGNQMPSIPSYPAIPKKAGYVRGYVKDSSGQPLEGAAIGLKTATIGVTYFTAAAKTDASGYYEIKIPLGGAKFHYAGYTIDYGNGRAALSLHPADGKLSESIAAAVGAVENFVLLSYGITDRNLLNSGPSYRDAYYGGSFKLIYYIAPPGQDASDFPDMVASGSTIEITLTAEGGSVDGGEGKSFVIRKTVEDSSLGEFYINNLPIGRYRIGVKTSNGKPLRLRQKSPTDSLFGLQPKEATGSALLTFAPLSAKPETAMAARSNWSDLEIVLQRP